MFCSFFISLLLLINSYALECPAQIRNHQPKIAIVGGNTIGLFLAERLARISGICPQNIVIYEKDTTVEYLSQSVDTSEGVFDLGPIVFPSYTYRIGYDEDNNMEVDTNPFYEPLLSYINKANVHYVSHDGVYYKNSSKTDGLGLPWLRPQQTLDSNQFRQEIGELLILMEQLQSMKSISDIYDNDFAWIGETVYNWFDRHGYSLAGQYLMWLYDTIFGGAPSYYMSAARFWYIWDIVGLPFMANVLIDAGIDPDVPAFDDHPFLRYVLKHTQDDDTKTWRIVNGTQRVYEALVEQLEAWGVVVCLNETVIQIEYEDYKRDNDDPQYRRRRRLSDNNHHYDVKYDSSSSSSSHDSSSAFANPYRSSSWSSNSDLPRHTSRRHKPMRVLSTGWGLRSYDFVINVARVHETINILKQEDFPVLYYLFGQITTHPSIFNGLFEYTPSNNDPEWIDDINNNGPTFIFDEGSMLGTVNAFQYWDGALDCYPVSIERRNNILLINTYIDNPNDINSCNNEILSVLQSTYFNLTNVQVLSNDNQAYTFRYPDTLPVNEEYNGWYEAMHYLQGNHGLFNINEPVTGETIYAQLKWIMHNTEKVSEWIWNEFEKRMDAMHKCDFKKKDKDLPVYMKEPMHKMHKNKNKHKKNTHY